MTNIFEVAWENAIELTNRNPNQYRMCYLCKRIMNHGNRWNSEKNQNGGINIDHVNGNKLDNRYQNLVVVHYICNVDKGSEDETQLYNRVKSETWHSE